MGWAKLGKKMNKPLLKQGMLVLCFMLFAMQLQAQTYSRTETITYSDNTSKWVLGQVASVTCSVSAPASNACNGDVVSQTAYDATYALPAQTKAFGKIQQSFTYDTASSVASGQRGTLKTVKDGNNNVTTLTSWKRGIPQSITFPATTDQPTAVTQKATVDDNGWITSVTDENGYKTCYGHDAMGRINTITYPSEAQIGVCDASTWTPTTITFNEGNPAAYGMPAGHWRQTTLTGRGRKIIIYDALWRPVVEQTLDLDRVSTSTSEVIRRYDVAGRLEFQSYPMNTGGAAVYTDPALKGTHTTYDALDRVTAVKQDSELGVLTTTTAYLYNVTGPYTQVTNPRGAQVRTWYQAYDQPSYDAPVIIQNAGTAYTDIARDPFGKPTSITRRNGSGSITESRNYAYNANQELCSQFDPEAGTTLRGYDGAGNLAWSAAGLPAGIACDAEGDTAAILARRVGRGYDTRNRLKSVVFPDHLGDTTYAYAPDGQLASITADNGGTNQVTTQYSYNRRRLMAKERMLWGSIDWSIDYAYNANGHLSQHTYPGALVVPYAPNALGQPTQAGSYASTVAYYPNGAIKSFTYGNNITHTLTQNARGLPDRSRDVYGSTVFLDDGYDYDQNGNVAAISDGTSGNPGDRTMTYDALDRLTKTVAPGMFGTATYTYDALDNLTRVQLTGGQVRDHYYCYDTGWRLTNVKTGSCSGATVMGLGYDVQGNLTNRSGTAFTFDYGNRLRTAGGSPASSYVYDGHGRRARDYTTGSKYSQYSSSGQLMFASNLRNHLQSWYIYLGSSLVAVRERNTDTGVATNKYQHTDALGSPVAMTSQSRAVLEKRKYEPYGSQIAPTPQDGPGYTGHVYDVATGMIYMQQRYYDPLLGRFLSVDPVTAYESPGQSFNRYDYALNNPYRFTDPDGRESACVSSGSGCGIDDAKFSNAMGRIAQFARNLWGSLSGGIMRTTGEAIAADAAFANGVITDNVTLQKVALDGMQEHVTLQDGINAAMMAVGPRGARGEPGAAGQKVSMIDRAAFAKERAAYWKSEAKNNSDSYGASDLARMGTGRAPIGSDGYPMELHHVNRTPEGGLKPMTRTEHRLGENYRKNHPDL